MPAALRAQVASLTPKRSCAHMSAFVRALGRDTPLRINLDCVHTGSAEADPLRQIELAVPESILGRLPASLPIRPNLAPLDRVGYGAEVATGQPNHWTKGKTMQVRNAMYTAKDVAEIFRMPLTEVYRAAKAGEIPGRIRVGGRTRFCAAVIDAFVNGQSTRRGV